jgi:hypothetical protein
MARTKETSGNYVVCPRCKGDYWADPFRKCSNCLNGRVLAPEPAGVDDLRLAVGSLLDDDITTSNGLIPRAVKIGARSRLRSRKQWPKSGNGNSDEGD